jgi:microcystin-dependent protein
MSNPFVAEIRIFPFNFAPKGWAFCAGQLMPISQNTALFSLLGTFYGGDGKSNFALPNLQGSVPIQQGQGAGLSLYDLGQTGGVEFVTLLTSEMPSHNHTVRGDFDNNNATATSTNNAVPVNAGTTKKTFSNSTTPQLVTMNPSMIGVVGGNSPHNNLMPYLTLNYCIALQGVFPARN